MNNLNKKIVTLIPSATEIVAFIRITDKGCELFCDFPKDLKNIVKLTSPKINVEGTSGEIDKQINVILENSLSVYKVDVEKLKKLDPDFIVTQSHCEVCAVSFSEVENIVREHLNQKTKIISLQPNTLNEVLDDIRRVASDLEINKEKSELLIGNLEKRLESIRDKAKNKKKPKVACVEWLDPLMIAGNWIPEMVLQIQYVDSNMNEIIDEEIKKQEKNLDIKVKTFKIFKIDNELENLLKKNIEWHSLKAFKDGNLFVKSGNVNSPREGLIESIEILAAMSQPV